MLPLALFPSLSYVHQEEETKFQSRFSTLGRRDPPVIEPTRDVLLEN
jgi:hypothetical protein